MQRREFRTIGNHFKRFRFPKKIILSETPGKRERERERAILETSAFVAFRDEIVNVFALHTSRHVLSSI